MDTSPTTDTPTHEGRRPRRTLDGRAQHRLIRGLAGPDPSARLQSALSAGIAADGFDPEELAAALLARCAVEADFYVRDMLTWALCRLAATSTVPLLLAQLASNTAQARSQSLHTLSKIGDAATWLPVLAMLHDGDDEVAASAWRAAAVLVPAGEEATLAAQLAGELGRGAYDTQRSLSRALAGIGTAAAEALASSMTHPDPRVRAHAEATERLRLDPDSAFELSSELALRAAALGP